MRRFSLAVVLPKTRLQLSCSVLLRALCCALFTIEIAPTDALADPITAIYDVQILQRFSREGTATGTVEPFAQAFTLAMTFSPGAAEGFGIYGRPTFSAVPLEVPAPPAGLALQTFGSTTHISLASGGFVAVATTGATGNTGSDDNFTVYEVIIDLRRTLLSSTPPEQTTAETFPLHLGSLGIGSQNPFNFSYDACLGVGPFGTDADSCTDARGAATRIVDYSGIATLRETTASPVSEPSSLLLVGGGLAVVRARRKQRAMV